MNTLFNHRKLATSVRVWRFFPGADEIFLFHMQTFRNAVDVVEVGNHLRCIVNRPIVKAMIAQILYVMLAHSGGWVGQLSGIGAKSIISFSQSCLSPIGCDMVDKEIRVLVTDDVKVFDLSPEVVSVGANSVNAVVFYRNHHSQHLALATG